MFHVTARIFTSDNVHSLDNVTCLKNPTFFHERIFQKYYWLIFVQFFMWFYTGYRVSYNYKSDISERGNSKGHIFFFIFIIPKGVGVTKNSSQQPATRLVLILPRITNVWINYNCYDFFLNLSHKPYVDLTSHISIMNMQKNAINRIIIQILKYLNVSFKKQFINTLYIYFYWLNDYWKYIGVITTLWHLQSCRFFALCGSRFSKHSNCLSLKTDKIL